jgi:NAD(P)-dependent dehydrogenase (short-subunit alcohol dehydrogenase family)
LTDIERAPVADRAAELRPLGIAAFGMEQDVTKEKSWSEAIAATVERFGGLNILVNNAGICVLSPIENTSLDSWNRQMSVNAASVFLGCKAAIAQVRKQGSGGSIVNVSSTAGLVGTPRESSYVASKGAVRLFTKAIALKVAMDGIRVNSVHPGTIMTGLQQVVIDTDPDPINSISAIVPLKRMGDPGDIASAILYLASAESKYVTGAALVVDGGLTAG